MQTEGGFHKEDELPDNIANAIAENTRAFMEGNAVEIRRSIMMPFVAAIVNNGMSVYMAISECEEIVDYILNGKK